jgi:photosystem II stability/assembly factor-like uncharacterized protein
MTKEFVLRISNSCARGRVVHRALLFRTLLFALLLLTTHNGSQLTAHCSPLTAYSSWQKQKTGTFAWLHSVFFVDESKGWAVGGKGALLATSDGGERWELRKRPTEDAMHDVFFTDARTGWIVCERSIFAPMRKDESVSYLLKTTDGGETWARVDVTRGEDVDVKLAGLRFADASHGWVYGEEGALYATSDGGETWARQRVPTRHLLLGASFVDARTGWLSGGGLTLLTTTDGGATWRAGMVYAPAASSTSEAPAQSRKGVEASAVQQTATTSQRLNAVSFADALTGWAVGAGGAIFSTSDGGRSWRPQRSGVESDLSDVKFLDRAEGWAVGVEGAVLHTTDGGQTWKSETRQTTHALERLCFVGRRRAWAVGFGGTVIAFKG